MIYVLQFVITHTTYVGDKLRSVIIGNGRRLLGGVHCRLTKNE